MRIFSIILSALLLTACDVRMADYEPPAKGIPLSFQTEMGPAFFATRYVDVFVAAQTAPCLYKQLGAIRFDDMPNGTVLAAQVPHNLRALFVWDGGTQINETVIDHMITPKPGASYELRMVDDKSRIGMRLFENGKLLPIKRPCITDPA